MKNTLNRFSTILLMALFMSPMALKAQMELPQPSPAARVMQTVGTTEIEIDYSAPGVKDREVWGKLVPYDSLWRAGANSPTKISFSKDVKISGEKVAKGEYSLFAIPNKGEWTFILNKDSNGNGVFSYDKGDDVLRFKGKPEAKTDHQERLAYYIHPDADDQGTVTLRWEKMAISFAVETSPMANLKAAAAQFVQQNWFNLASASEYMVKAKEDANLAMQMADASIALAGENLFNVWVKAQVLSAQGKKTEAIAWAQKAQKMGEESKGGFRNFYLSNVKTPLEASLKEWK